MGWRLWEHTADIGIDADGADAGECLGHAAHALAAIVTGTEEGLPLRGGSAQEFRVEAPDIQALAVAFLSELLWLIESEGLLWTSGGVDVTIGEESAADARANMVRYDTRQHGRGVEVKAVTYHQLFFGRDGDRWRLRVLLDI